MRIRKRTTICTMTHEVLTIRRSSRRKRYYGWCSGCGAFAEWLLLDPVGERDRVSGCRNRGAFSEWLPLDPVAASFVSGASDAAAEAGARGVHIKAAGSGKQMLCANSLLGRDGS